MSYRTFQDMTNGMVISELGRRFKEYRIQYRYTQQQVAEQTGVSIATLRNFENGRLYNINLNNFLALLRVVGRIGTMEEVLPTIPMSAYDLEKLIMKKRRRVRTHN